MIIDISHVPDCNEKDNFIDLLLLSGWVSTGEPGEYIFYSEDMKRC